MLSAEFDDATLCKAVAAKCLGNGLITHGFLFSETSLRVSPPLIITEEQIEKACNIFIESIEEVVV